ncbi:hypothetical protein, partial [Klebsiella pneumoniae]|uniref:hypothetical protein n=1 Tax=Klebsiella pneumoniae TaxID=573 RepID=UPI00385361C9
MRENKPNAPSPQELAAYYDGELEPAARARVAAWLAEHPEMSADLEAQHALPQAAPPEPSEAAWSSVLERIDERTKTIKARQR